MKHEQSVQFDITRRMQSEITRILSITDIASVPDVFAKAFTLLRIHIEAAVIGQTIHRSDGTEIVLPFQINCGGIIQ